jgi:DNA-binding transcriptional LysR family regulator
VEIRKLEAFAKVVEMKSFSRAAEQLLLSQPTVSEHVRTLEQELQQTLLDRLGRTVEPTPVGKLFYGYVIKILRTREEAVEAVQHYGTRLVGRITIGAGTIPGTYVLPELIGRFRGKYPSIKATLHISSSQLIAQAVLAGEMDLGVVGAKWNQKGLEWTKLFADEMSLVVYPGHPWANKERVSLAELLSEPFIMREPGSATRKVFAHILEENKMRESELQEVAEIGSTAAIKEAVKAGLGISVLSKCAVQEDVESGRLRMLAITDCELKRSFYMIERSRRKISPAATLFRDSLCGKGDQQIS